MQYLSVKETAIRFSISERRVQKLCEEGRIEDAQMISGVWVIPENASKPIDERSAVVNTEEYMSLTEVCELLSVSIATGRNWIKLEKLVPDYYEKKTPIFKKEYIVKLKQEIESGKNRALKSRRNKKFVSGNALYNSYVSEKCTSIRELQKILVLINEQAVDLDSFVVSLLVGSYAYQLITQKYHKDEPASSFLAFLKNGTVRTFRDLFILDLVADKEQAISYVENNPLLFSIQIDYEEYEDVLGLLYISCKNLGNRKATGSYYTSTKVVKKMVSQLNIKATDRVLDPCCGTGNFLLQLPANIGIKNIYGNDIDDISVKITRINMSLKYSDADYDTICTHITKCNYLSEYQNGLFSYIIGNPPWGYEYSSREVTMLEDKYISAKGKKIESYDVFIEEALSQLKEDGELSFVLPEAILNVKAHQMIREVILSEASISYLEFLGNAFDGVQCPCIIMQIKKDRKGFSTKGMRINDGKREFAIASERSVSAEYFSFITNDEEYSIIKKLQNAKGVTYLEGKADFALGIVTGNNKEYISDIKTDDNEMVLKGADISKYHINPTDNYIVFEPERFQQIAPTVMYRAKEKLLYRFISSQLVFAFDDKGTLSLNSCNIVIPRIEGLHIKYIMAILNSRVAQFIYKMQFNSVKVLRSHIERIPIPVVNDSIQREVIRIQEPLVCGLLGEEADKQYDLLDNYISKLYGLKQAEMDIIKQAVDGENKFLY